MTYSNSMDETDNDKNTKSNSKAKPKSLKGFYGCMKNLITIKGDIVNVSFEDEWDINND